MRGRGRTAGARGGAGNGSQVVLARLEPVFDEDNLPSYRYGSPTELREKWEALSRLLNDLRFVYECLIPGSTPKVAAGPFLEWRARAIETVSSLESLEVHATNLADLTITVRRHEHALREEWANSYERGW